MQTRQPQIREGAKTTSFCHVQIKKTAMGLAEQNYDELMSNDWIYAQWKLKHPGKGPKALLKLFVAAKWGLYVPAARATLGLLLRQPIDDALKLEIVDVLAKDQSLIPGRLNPMVVTGQVTERK